MDVTTCRRCRRPIRAADSLATGYGPDCLIKELADRLRGFPVWQVEKAWEAFETGAAVPTARPGQYVVASSDGSQFYVANARLHTCTCRGAQCGNRCYHVALVIIAEVAAPLALAA